jgi:hypothetical protein
MVGGLGLNIFIILSLIIDELLLLKNGISFSFFGLYSIFSSSSSSSESSISESVALLKIDIF